MNETTQANVTSLFDGYFDDFRRFVVAHTTVDGISGLVILAAFSLLILLVAIPSLQKFWLMRFVLRAFTLGGLIELAVLLLHVKPVALSEKVVVAIIVTILVAAATAQVGLISLRFIIRFIRFRSLRIAMASKKCFVINGYVLNVDYLPIHLSVRHSTTDILLENAKHAIPKTGPIAELRILAINGFTVSMVYEPLPQSSIRLNDSYSVVWFHSPRANENFTHTKDSTFTH